MSAGIGGAPSPPPDTAAHASYLALRYLRVRETLSEFPAKPPQWATKPEEVTVRPRKAGAPTSWDPKLMEESALQIEPRCLRIDADSSRQYRGRAHQLSGRKTPEAPEATHAGLDIKG